MTFSVFSITVSKIYFHPKWKKIQSLLTFLRKNAMVLKRTVHPQQKLVERVVTINDNRQQELCSLIFYYAMNQLSVI